MNHLVDLQIQRNTATRDYWDVYTPHRQEIAKHLIHSFDCGTTRLCVLGAGNCNDLDLKRLTTSFREIHLIDLDGQALRAGVARQKVTGYSAVYLHEDIDVTGVFHLLVNWTPDKLPSDIKLDACLEQAMKPANLDVPAPFDVVASVCLLSQLIDATILTLGPNHPRLLDLILSIRAGHLRLMTELLAPGGVGLLIIDIVSSETAPDLVSIAESEFTRTVVQFVKNRNFFTGTNPFAIRSSMQTDPTIAPFIARLQLVRPWRWSLGKRVYAVFAIKFQRTKYGLW